MVQVGYSKAGPQSPWLMTAPDQGNANDLAGRAKNSLNFLAYRSGILRAVPAPTVISGTLANRFGQNPSFLLDRLDKELSSSAFIAPFRCRMCRSTLGGIQSGRASDRSCNCVVERGFARKQAAAADVWNDRHSAGCTFKSDFGNAAASSPNRSSDDFTRNRGGRCRVRLTGAVGSHIAR